MDCDLKGLSAENKTRIQKLDAKMALLERDREALGSKLGRYRDKLRENNYDGNKPECVSLTAMFYRLKASRPEMAGERGTLLAARMKYSQAQGDLADADALREKLSDEREQLLGEMNGSLREGAPQSAMNERDELAQCRLRELGKAVSAGREASAYLDNVEEDLLKLDELGEASGGMLSSAVIIEYIHAARAQAGLAQRLMYAFRYALAGEDWCGTDALTEFADHFLDCMVMDFVPNSRVQDSLACVRDAQNGLSAIIARLDAMIENEREALRKAATGADGAENRLMRPDSGASK